MSSRQETPAPVWVVNRYEEVDGPYVFTDEDTAREFASRFTEVTISEEPLLSADDGVALVADDERGGE